MELLTRAEEVILLAVWRLGENAYSLPIRKKILEITGENWSLGAVYMPLERLVKRGYVESYFSDSTPERGGRHKRIYRLTYEGKRALEKTRKIQDALWEDLPDILPEAK